MLKQVLKTAISLSALSMILTTSTSAFADPIADAVNSENRPAEQRIRDEYRNPQATLRFFDIQPDMAVAEISPGGGWYSHILAPLLKEKGQFYAAHNYVYEGAHEYYERTLNAFKKKISANPDFANIKITAFHHNKAPDFAPAGSLDRVLTFRNVHNWYMDGEHKGLDNAFASYAKALKKGGILGLVEHKLPESADDEMQKSSGYMKQSLVIAAAEKAGFKLIGESPVNFNPLDTKDHEKGVWTLMPSLSLGDKDREKYLAIGESDRMTLKFEKM